MIGLNRDNSVIVGEQELEEIAPRFGFNEIIDFSHDTIHSVSFAVSTVRGQRSSAYLSRFAISCDVVRSDMR